MAGSAAARAARSPCGAGSAREERCRARAESRSNRGAHRRLAEREVVLGRGGPDVADAVVGTRDPDVLPGGIGWPSVGARELVAVHLDVRPPVASAARSRRRAEVRLAQLLPDRVEHAGGVRARMRRARPRCPPCAAPSSCCPSRRTRPRGDRGLRGCGSCRSGRPRRRVTPYDLYGSRVNRWLPDRRREPPRAGPLSGETILSVMNAR